MTDGERAAWKRNWEAAAIAAILFLPCSLAMPKALADESVPMRAVQGYCLTESESAQLASLANNRGGFNAKLKSLGDGCEDWRSKPTSFPVRELKARRIVSGTCTIIVYRTMLVAEHAFPAFPFEEMGTDCP